MSKEKQNIVADLGGTNIRFGLAAPHSTTVDNIRRYSIRDYESVRHLLQVYLRDSGIDKSHIAHCCFAIAGPIKNQQVKMTNCDWEISASTIDEALGIDNTVLINDFQAIAYSVTHIPESGMVRIGELSLEADRGPISVLGPGTGLGAALLVPTISGDYTIVPTEGGHVALSARSEDELKIFDYWRNKGCRINREFFLSGIGLERIYEALCVDAGRNDYKKISVSQIQQTGCAREDELCERAMNTFCAFLGSAAGDQVLCTGSTGGLVLAGGILPKFVDFLQESPFRKRFESKGSMSDYTRRVATVLIVEEQPGLIGAAAYLRCN